MYVSSFHQRNFNRVLNSNQTNFNITNNQETSDVRYFTTNTVKSLVCSPIRKRFGINASGLKAGGLALNFNAEYVLQYTLVQARDIWNGHLQYEIIVINIVKETFGSIDLQNQRLHKCKSASIQYIKDKRKHLYNYLNR